MRPEQMKEVKVDEVLLDSFNSSKMHKAITCMVVEVQQTGLLVTAANSQSCGFYYNETTGKKEELIPWSKAYSLELIDPARIGEGGYLPY